MTAPMDKRTYLMSLNPPLAKPGRGKFSTAAHEALKAAEAAGIVFLDKGVAQSTVTVIGDDGERTTETRNIDVYAAHPEAIREGVLTFTRGKVKLSVNATEACEECQMSFGWCYCATPTFRYWKDSEVYSLND